MSITGVSNVAGITKAEGLGFAGLLIEQERGEILFDDFDEGAQQNDVANGWTEVEASAGEQDVGITGTIGILRHPADDGLTSSVHRQILNVPNDIIIQINPQFLASPADSEINFRMFGNNSGFTDEFYRLQTRDDTNRMRLAHWSGGAEQGGAEASLQVSRPNQYQIRHAIERSGADTILRGYSIGGDPPTGTGLDMTSGDFTLLPATHTHVSGQFVGNWFQIQLVERMHLNYFLMCGRNVEVSGLPPGWKIKIDTRAPIVESGGIAIADVDKFEMPMVQLQLLNPLDVVTDTKIPTPLQGRQGDQLDNNGGLVGGARYIAI